MLVMYCGDIFVNDNLFENFFKSFMINLTQDFIRNETMMSTDSASAMLFLS